MLTTESFVAKIRINKNCKVSQEISATAVFQIVTAYYLGKHEAYNNIEFELVCAHVSHFGYNVEIMLNCNIKI